jgi:hypothetical protein
MADQVLEVIVLRIRLQTYFVLEGDGESNDEIEERHFGKEILLAFFAFSFFGMTPNVA